MFSIMYSGVSIILTNWGEGVHIIEQYVNSNTVDKTSTIQNTLIKHTPLY